MKGFERKVDHYSRVDFSAIGGKSEILKRFMSYLNELGVPYEGFTYQKPWEATSAEIAEGLGIPKEEMAQVVVLRADDQFVMTVLPVDWKVDLEKVKEMLRVEEIRPATARELERLFPDYDPDAIPPFGSLCRLRICLDIALLDNESIAFHVGSRRQILRIKIADFARLSCPCVGDIRLRPHRMTVMY